MTTDASSQNVERKTLLLTGASRGIGHATVKRFGAAGWRVLTVSRHAFSPDCPWDGGEENHVQLDLSDPDTIERGVADLKRRLAPQGRLDALVNNAGISPKLAGGARMGVLASGYADWQRVFTVNLFATALLGRGLFDELAAARGTIINVTSIAGGRVHPFAGSAYAASKAGLAALTREMAHEFGPHGIRVNAIAPGWIKTEISRRGRENPEFNAKVVARLPNGAWAEPEELAGTAIFLASSASALINGVTIPVDGGYVAS